MPDKITIDDALGAKSAQPSNRITFDEALNTYNADSAERQQKLQSEYQQVNAQPDPYTNPLVVGDRPEEKPYLSHFKAPIEDAKDSRFVPALKAHLVDDPETKRRLIAQDLFPNDPKGIDRVGIIDGVPVYVDDTGQLVRVASRTKNAAAIATANAPEAIGATIGATSGSPVFGGALGATAGKAGKQILANLAFNEPQTSTGNAIELAKEATLNTVTGGLAKGAAKLFDRGKIVDFTPAERKAGETAIQQTKNATGIDLDLAQATGDRKLIALRAYAARYPGKSSEIIQAADEAAKGQFEGATNRALNVISSSAPSEIAGANGVNAAQMIIRATREKVSQQVKPLYDAAYAAVPEVTDAKILGMLKQPYFGEAFKNGQRIAELEDQAAKKVTETTTKTSREKIRDGLYREVTTEENKTVTKPDLRSLDYTKRALDDKIEMLKDAGRRQEARALKLKRDEFVDAIDSLPNQEWQAARQKYAELAKSTIEPLENGPVGVLANIKNPKFATAGSKILSDPNITAKQIGEARAQFSQQYPDEWNGLVRQWLGQKLNRAMKETQTGDSVNVAGKFRQAVYGTPSDQEKMRAMLPSEAVDSFESLMDAAQKLSSTPIAGSNTMRDTEIKDQLKGTGAVIFRWLTSPRESVKNAAEQRALENGTLQIAEALLDPAKRGQLKQVVKMAPSTKKAILISSILSGQAVDRAFLTGPDALPRPPKPQTQSMGP